MTSVLRLIVASVVAFASCVSLLTTSACAQGFGVPGVGVPGAGIGNPAMNLPQRQGPMTGGGAGGVPGQMNQRMGGAGMRPGQGIGMPSPGGGRSRGAGFAGVPQNAAGFSGMARGGIQQSSQGFIQNSRNAGINVPGAGPIRRGNQ